VKKFVVEEAGYWVYLVNELSETNQIHRIDHINPTNGVQRTAMVSTLKFQFAHRIFSSVASLMSGTLIANFVAGCNQFLDGPKGSGWLLAGEDGLPGNR
jgi:hypothetical protein